MWRQQLFNEMCQAFELDVTYIERSIPDAIGQASGREGYYTIEVDLPKIPTIADFVHVLLHEFGHIICGHVEIVTPEERQQRRTVDWDSKIAEIEARFLAQGGTQQQIDEIHEAQERVKLFDYEWKEQQANNFAKRNRVIWLQKAIQLEKGE